MGFYIETPKNKGKAEQICERHEEAFIIPQPISFSKVPVKMALICVVDNGPFEAAAYCYSEEEFKSWTDPRSQDIRPKKWVLMDKVKCEKLSGYGAKLKKETGKPNGKVKKHI